MHKTLRLRSKRIQLISMIPYALGLIIILPTPSFAASVWTQSLIHPIGTPYNLHIISSSDNILNSTTVTGVYLDSVLSSSVSPLELLEASPEDVWNDSPDQYDLFSLAPPTSSMFEQVDDDSTLLLSAELALAQLAVFEQDYYSESWVYNGSQPDTDSLYQPDTDSLYLDFLFGLTSEPLISTTPYFELTATSAVPVPATIWLFGSGLLGLISIAKQKKNA